MLVGHQKQWQFLKKSAQSGKLPHALLFYGQEKLGKKTLAVEFIKFLSCSENNINKKPCNKCRNCSDIGKEMHPDFFIVKPISFHQEIQISQIRELISKLSLRPALAPFKTAIVDQAHLMTQEAQNCFLKLLEEPKGNTLLILTTEHPEILLPTIISRVQKIRFSPVKNAEIYGYLIGRAAPEAKARKLAYIAWGRPGTAVDFFIEDQKIGDQEKIFSDFLEIKKSDLSSRFQYSKRLFEENDNLKAKIEDILEVWIQYLRNALFLRVANKNEADDEFSKEINKLFSISELKKIISDVQAAIFFLLTTNVNPRLTIENLLIKI